jgi:hypothetical protein
MRGVIPDLHSIHERPKKVEDRQMPDQELKTRIRQMAANPLQYSFKKPVICSISSKFTSAITALRRIQIQKD